MTLLDKINFEGKHYSEIKDQSDKQRILDIAAMLQPLEQEIINDPEGEIMLLKPGSSGAFGFEENLSARITKLLTR